MDGRPFEGPRSIRASDIIAALSVIGIDVSRDWLDGFCLPGLHRFRPTNCAEGCVFRKFPDTVFGKSRTGLSVNKSEERSVGKEWDSTCRDRGSLYNQKNNNENNK